MVSSATGAKNDLKHENLSMSLIPLLEWILYSNWSQKAVQLEVFPSNGEITNFVNLQLISSTELGGMEGWGENVELFYTIDWAMTWKEISYLLRIFSYSTSYSFGSKNVFHQLILPLILSSWLYFNPNKQSVYPKCHFIFLINWNTKLETKFWFSFLYWSWDIKHKNPCTESAIQFSF